MSAIELSYGFAAVVFSVLCTLAYFGWQGKPLGFRLLFACIAIVVWAAAVAFASDEPDRLFLVLYLAELLRAVAILWVIFGVAGKSVPRIVRWISYSAAFGLATITITGELFDTQIWTHAHPQTWLTRTGLFYSFIGLVALEQTYRNAHILSRRALNFFVLGFGSLFVYDLFLYSQVELFRGIRADTWMVRGLVSTFSAPMLALAMRRNPDWSLNIFVSRQVVFYTTAFLAVGVYLLFVAIGGYYVRLGGGTWGGIAQLFFFSGAIIVLFSIMFSQSVRRRTRVFLAKHFYRNKYDYRLTWLEFVATLSSKEDENMRATAIRAITQTMGSPGGTLYTIDDDNQRYVCTAAWPNHERQKSLVPEVSADDEIVRILARRHWIVDLSELHSAPDVYQNILAPEWLGHLHNPRMIAPVLELDKLTGFVVLEESSPSFQLTYEDRDLLKTLGRHVATYLAQHDASAKLAESRQFEAYNRLTAFMMHDLKNSVAQLKLIVTNAARHKTNPEFIDDTIDTIANAAERMSRLIEQLRGDAQLGATRRVDLNELVVSAAHRCGDREPVPTTEIGSVRPFVRADRDRLQAVLEHVIRNAQDATLSAGSILIKVETMGENALLSVIDSGHGMNEQFLRERLFKPFDSTKGSKGMGIGAYQVREYVRSLGGAVEVRSSPGRGTEFCLSLPIVAEG